MVLFCPQSFEEAAAPLDDEKHNDVDEDAEFSLQFHLGEVKSALSEIKDKVDDIRVGEIRPRTSRGSCELTADDN